MLRLVFCIALLAPGLVASAQTLAEADSLRNAYQLEAALSAYQKLSSNADAATQGKAYLGMGMIHLQSRRLLSAYEALSQAATKLEGNVTVLEQITQLMEQLGEYERALGYADKLVAAQPDKADHYHTRSKLHERTGNQDKALKDLQKAAELDAQNPRYTRGLVRLYEQAGQYDKAEAALNKLMEGSEGADFSSLNRRAELRMKSKNYQGAIEDYTAVMEKQPRMAMMARTRRAQAYLAAGQKDKACADLAKAVEEGNRGAESMMKQHCGTGGE